MRETFIRKNFNSDALEMIDKARRIMSAYQAQGYDLSLRQLYYQLVSQNEIPNSERSYKNLGVLVSDARMAGLLDWDMIKDRGREAIINPHWTDPADFLVNVAPQFKIDLWENQPCYVEVMVEKQALEGVLEPVCRKLDVPFTANKGYTSSSALYEASKRFLERALDGKSLHVIYLGDHDPSGIDMSRDVEERLDMFVKTSMGEADMIGGGNAPAVEMHRVALNMDQIKKLRPPENPAKLTDSRATSYVEKFGHSSWELDAVEPRTMAAMVSDEIYSLIDQDHFDNDKERMSEGVQVLKKMAQEYKDNQED